MIVVPLRRACLKKEDATGWLAVELLPVTIATSALRMSPKVVDTAPEPMPSNSADTLEAVDRPARPAAALAALALFLRAAVRPGTARHAVVIGLAAGRHVAPDVGRQSALRVGAVAADQRDRQALRRGGVVPAVPALDA